MFQTIEENIETEIVEKKSKFIANLIYVTSEEMAEEELQKVRKKYHDARHNCYAYRIQKENNFLTKSSDDGEPSGTAGAPMLNLLIQQNLGNVVIVVGLHIFRHQIVAVAKVAGVDDKVAPIVFGPLLKQMEGVPVGAVENIGVIVKIGKYQKLHMIASVYGLNYYSKGK